MLCCYALVAMQEARQLFESPEVIDPESLKVCPCVGWGNESGWEFELGGFCMHAEYLLLAGEI